MLTVQLYEGIDHDDFLFRLIEAGHTAIFQWIAVYVASIIGLITMISELLKLSHTLLYLFIYVAMVGLMTNSLLSGLNVMHNQNIWAKKLNNSKQRQLFFDSRSWIIKKIVGEKEKKSNWEKAIIVAHVVVLIGFGLWLWFKGDSLLTILNIYLEKA